MADLTLRISADFDKAQKAFADLANSSDETRKKIENFADAYQEKELNSFIDKQKLLEAALTGTRGEVDAMKAASNNYNKEIERLIKNGLSPESEAIKKLSQEHKLLELRIKETTAAKKNLEAVYKGVETACYAYLTALTAAGVAVLAMTNETAKLGDELAKTSEKLGLTAEELQELDYAAKSSGVSDIRGHLEKLNKTLIDVQNESGNLTKYLQENDTALLNQVKSAKSNSQAFDLLMNAIKNTQDPLKKSELAMAAFGKSGQDIILMANKGADGISALKEEARKYGIISNEAAKNAEAYMDSQTRLQTSLANVRNEIGNALMPVITNIMQKIADAISSVDDWDKVLKTATDTIITLTATVGTFLLVMKIAPVINTAVKAINVAGGAMAALRIKILAVNTAIAANPIGLIATAIAVGVGIIVGALTKAINRQKDYTNSINENTNSVNRNLRAQDVLAASTRRGSFETSTMYSDINALLQARTNNLRLLTQAQEEARRANERGETRIAERKREEAQGYIEYLQKIEDRLRTLAHLQGQVYENGQIKNETINTPVTIPVSYDIDSGSLEETKKTLMDFIKDVVETDKQSLSEQISNVENYLLQRADLEANSYEEKIAFLLEKKEELLALEYENQNDRVAIEQATNAAIIKSKEELAKRDIELLEMRAKQEMELLEQRMSANASFFGCISSLLEIAGDKNKKAAVAAKAFAMVEAGINTALAATKSLTAAPFPWNIALMAGTVAAGVAQQIKIATTNIPSAETGGRFIVPHTNSVDGGLLRVNQNEEVIVKPAGQTGNDRESFNFNLIVNEEVIAKVTNKLARAGELYTLQLASNL